MFELNDEEKAIQATAREFTSKEIIPRAAEYDQSMAYPWDVVKAAHAAGLMNMCAPESVGGLGLGTFAGNLVVEELAYGCSGMSTAITVNELALAPVIHFGNQEQLEEFVAPMMNEPIMAAYCVTEPGAGSDVASIRTTIKDDGDHYLLNGQKMWITNASVAKWFYVLASKDPKAGHKAMCALAVPADLDGITIGKKEVNMGQRCSDTRGISFDNVKVPKKYLIGEEGQGFKIAMRAFDHSRPSVAAGATGVARAAMDHAIRYAHERQTFGMPIARHQAVSFMIADMAKDIEAGRLLYYQASKVYDAGGRNTKLASFAKCFAGDAVVRITQDAVQIFGGYGFNNEYPVEKLYRDAKIYQIYEGTNQIQRLIIAREVFQEQGV